MPRLFPILNGSIFKAIPFDLIEPHREQARVNHGQTLERLGQRGGLSPAEAMAVLKDEKFKMMDKEVSETQLGVAVASYLLGVAKGQEGE